MTSAITHINKKYSGLDNSYSLRLGHPQRGRFELLHIGMASKELVGDFGHADICTAISTVHEDSYSYQWHANMPHILSQSLHQKTTGMVKIYVQYCSE